MNTLKAPKTGAILVNKIVWPATQIDHSIPPSQITKALINSGNSKSKSHRIDIYGQLLSIETKKVDNKILYYILRPIPYVGDELFTYKIIDEVSSFGQKMSKLYNKTCVICEEFYNDDTRRIMSCSVCHNKVCKKDVYEWFETKTTCPRTNHPCTLSDFHVDVGSEDLMDFKQISDIKSICESDLSELSIENKPIINFINKKICRCFKIISSNKEHLDCLIDIFYS
jgi:hypothetical protein